MMSEAMYKISNWKQYYRLLSRGPVAHVVIDATGLKVFGEGEWKMHKHGKEKRRVWGKLHLAIDGSTYELISTAVTHPRSNYTNNSLSPWNRA